ncbi:hypothetical protein [Flavobacterium sp. UMI-01]|uniref:phage baseplate protein n=1 Tax=Flavobacterium sp. UMI-01 TaxID=1441053 RepID=UPI001C7D6229|nr:hypothetical protein [Flavobacterium sp. UMI-01]GIZ09972.1 hypothetical protein FUMI01_26980 [Flavobacterium sp. UMI-01]
MNKSTFIQTGGYPLKAERLQELETAYSIFNSLGALAGNLTIISGCVLSGSTIGDGFVYINGELLDFREADVTEGSTVIIIEEPVERGFKNGVIKQVHTIRYATFGTADTSWLWTDFKRVDPMVVMMSRLETLEKKSAVFQAGGGMVLWNKPAADIPAGWQEVVDWRGRMPVGFDATQTEFNVMGKPGGAKNKTLSIAELPQHDHFMFSNDTVDAGVAITSSNSPVKEGYNAGGDGNQNYRIRSSNNTPTVGKTSQKGSGQEFSILNPYRVVMFIEYIG